MDLNTKISLSTSSTSPHTATLSRINELDQKIQKKTTGIFGILYKLFGIGKSEVQALRTEKYEAFKKLIHSPISQETITKVTKHIETEISRLKAKAITSKHQKIITAHEILLKQSTITFDRITILSGESETPCDAANFRKGHTTDGDFGFSLPVGKKTLLLKGLGVNEKGTLNAMGGFGRVYCAQDGDNKVAVKVMKLFFNDPAMKAEALNEIDTLLKMQGQDYIIGASEVIYITEEANTDPSYACIIMKNVDGGSLDKIGENDSESSLNKVAQKKINALRDAALGLTDLHKLGIVHCDIKADNVLVDNSTGKSILIDLGLCIRIGKLSGNTGTEAYFAPEHTKAAKEEFIKQTGAKDIYAFGVMAHKLFSNISTLDTIPNLSHTKDFISNPKDYVALPESLRKEAGELIEKCLKFSPEERINSKDLADKLNELAKKMENLS